MSSRFIPSDRRAKSQPFDDLGRKQERLSEYFDFRTWPEKREQKVTRQELLALLTRKWVAERESAWFRRLWRFLRAPVGSAPRPIGGGTRPATPIGSPGDPGTMPVATDASDR